MLKVALKTPRAGSLDYDTAATLCIQDSGEWHVDGNARLFMFDHTAVSQATGDWVAFADDPIDWARSLGSIYRTGYLVPVVIEDTNDGEDTND